MDQGTQQGYLVLADITGYTAYMAGTELDHSREILREVIKTIVGTLTPTLRLAEVEGDAVFVYGPHQALTRGETLLELIEHTYVAFRDFRESMKRSTSCTCNACRSISTLDLKFISHFGTFALERMAGKTKPIGSDVNLAHRLLKNHVGEKTGWRAYAMFTEVCLDRMQVAPEAAHRETESYEHLGTIETKSVNLARMYEGFVQARRVFISPEEAHCVVSTTFPAPPPVVWDWLNDSGKKERWMVGTTWKDLDRPLGRTGVGAVNHCCHGKESTTEYILDWRPFSYVTSEYRGNPVTMRMTRQLVPVGNETRMDAMIRLDLPLPDLVMRPFVKFLVVKVFKLPADWQKLREVLEQEERETTQTA